MALITSGCVPLQKRHIWEEGEILPGAPAGAAEAAGERLAVGETATLLHPPLPSAGVLNRDGEGASAE